MHVHLYIERLQASDITLLILLLLFLLLLLILPPSYTSPPSPPCSLLWYIFGLWPPQSPSSNLLCSLLPSSMSVSETHPWHSSYQHLPISYVMDLLPPIMFLGIWVLFTLLYDQPTVISWRCHIIIKFPDLRTVSNSPNPLGLCTSEYIHEDFPFKGINHSDGFLEWVSCFANI